MDPQCPTLINVHKKDLVKGGYENFEDWNSRPNHLYIGRNMSFYVKGAAASEWRNPFTVKKYGRDGCLVAYEKHIRETMLDKLKELTGKELGCWCVPDPCHGDILIKIWMEVIGKK